MRAGTCTGDNIAVPHTAYSFDVDCGLDVKGHACLENSRRCRMNPWKCVRIGCGKTDAVTGERLKGFSKPVTRKNAAGEPITGR